MRLQIYNQQDASAVEYEFQKPDIFVGTSSTNDIVLYHPSLSGRHLRISLENGSLEVVDLDSRTGTFVNGDRIRGRMSVTERDVISLGSSSIRFVKEPEALSQDDDQNQVFWEILHDKEEERFDESLSSKRFIAGSLPFWICAGWI